MPLNEARGFNTRGNLNKQQRKDALAAIYGVTEPTNTMPEAFSHEDIERMRQLIAQHDSSNQLGGIKEFDLNNPPKVPYVFQEFPRIVYHHDKRVHRVAHHADDLAAALEAGWSKEPFPMEAEEPELDAESAREVAAVEEKLAKLRKKK